LRASASTALRCFRLYFASISYTVVGWQRGSVIRTSVSGWRTFLDLCLIYGWHVTASWVKCPLWVNQPGQLSLPSPGVGNDINYGGGDH